MDMNYFLYIVIIGNVKYNSKPQKTFIPKVTFGAFLTECERQDSMLINYNF